MKNKNLGIIMMMLLVAAQAFAAVTIQAPSADTTRSGSILFNASFDAVAPSVTSISCNFTLTGQSQFNSSAVTLATSQANTSGTTYVNLTYDTAQFRDQLTNVDATCSNGTSQSATQITNVRLDNTAPTCTFSGASSGGKIKTGVSFSMVTTNSLSSKMFFDSNPFTGNVDVADTATVNLQKGQPSEGFYNSVYLQVDDGLNASTCAITGLTVDDERKGTLDLTVPIQQVQQKKATNSLVIIGIIGIVAYMLFAKKKR